MTKTKLGQYFKIKHGYAFKGEHFSDSGPYILLTPGNFYEKGGFKKKGAKEKYYTGEVPNNFMLKKHDLIIAMTEQGEGLLGSSALVPDSDLYLHNQRLGLVESLDEKRLQKKFLYYLLNTSDIRAQIRATANGAKVRHTSPSRIYDVEANIPSIGLQRRIASILSAYDDLIENNTRRIGILEEMARRLYEEWFVHFRFPGHEHARFKETELGRIPEGWTTTEVQTIIKRLRPGTIYKEADVESHGSVLVIDQSRTEFLGFHNNEPDHEASSKHPVIIFGDHTCKMQIMVTPFSLGPNTIAFMGSGNHSLYYIYLLVKGLIHTQEYKRHWNEFMGKLIVEAPSQLTAKFGEIVEPMFQLIHKLREKNRNLRTQRDLLLPKLVSGELDVSELPLPDHQIESAA